MLDTILRIRSGRNLSELIKINVKRIRSYHVCHYRMNTNNHILDVISNDEPSIKKVEMKLIKIKMLIKLIVRIYFTLSFIEFLSFINLILSI